jgi:hypothetical protein
MSLHRFGSANSTFYMGPPKFHAVKHATTGLAREGRLLFVNKKKQKNFIMLGHGRCR